LMATCCHHLLLCVWEKEENDDSFHHLFKCSSPFSVVLLQRMWQ
jgi:hypothetical protein